jgi:hypothetical protein
LKSLHNTRAHRSSVLAKNQETAQNFGSFLLIILNSQPQVVISSSQRIRPVMHDKESETSRGARRGAGLFDESSTLMNENLSGEGRSLSIAEIGARLVEKGFKVCFQLALYILLALDTYASRSRSFSLPVADC